jgi:hypothetical protein
MNSIDQALAELGLSTDGWEARASQLTSPTRAFYRSMLREIAASGRMPNAEWIEKEASRSKLDPARTVERLAESDLVVLSPEGDVVAAYPFSGHQTPHRVELSPGRAVYAMCAIDALGIPFMLNQDAQISSHDPRSGDPIRVWYLNQETRWDPSSAVVFVGSQGDAESIAERCCQVINFFRSCASAQAYQNEAPAVSGIILTQDQAVALGKRVFGNVLRADSST